MLDLDYRRAALEDLDAIYEYIAADDPGRAKAFIDEIRDRCAMLRRHPKRGPTRHDLRPGLRILPLRARVVIAYRITPSAIQIARVFYGGRDYGVLRADEP